MRESCDWRVGVLMQLAQEQQHWHKLCHLPSAAVKVQELCCLPERQLQLVCLQCHLWGAAFEENNVKIQVPSNGEKP